MLMQFMEAPTPLGYHDIEQAGLEYIKHLASHEEMTYQQAWDILDSHKKLVEEAIRILNWNAGVEMKNSPVKFVLKEEE